MFIFILESNLRNLELSKENKIRFSVIIAWNVGFYHVKRSRHDIPGLKIVGRISVVFLFFFTIFASCVAINSWDLRAQHRYSSFWVLRTIIGSPLRGLTSRRHPRSIQKKMSLISKRTSSRRFFSANRMRSEKIKRHWSTLRVFRIQFLSRVFTRSQNISGTSWDGSTRFHPRSIKVSFRWSIIKDLIAKWIMASSRILKNAVRSHESARRVQARNERAWSTVKARLQKIQKHDRKLMPDDRASWV